MLIEYNDEAIETELAKKLLILANNDIGKVKEILESVRDQQAEAFTSSLGIITNLLICGYSASQTMSLSEESANSDNQTPNPSIYWHSVVMASTAAIAFMCNRGKTNAQKNITRVFREIEGASNENQRRSGEGR